MLKVTAGPLGSKGRLVAKHVPAPLTSRGAACDRAGLRTPTHAFVVWSLQPTARCADQKAKPLSICSHMEADLFVTSLNEDKCEHTPCESSTLLRDTVLVCKNEVECDLSGAVEGVHVRFSGDEPRWSMQTPGHLRITNVGSSAPILIDGRKLNVNDSADLAPGCTLQLGDNEYVIGRNCMAHA